MVTGCVATSAGILSALCGALVCYLARDHYLPPSPCPKCVCSVVCVILFSLKCPPFSYFYELLNLKAGLLGLRKHVNLLYFFCELFYNIFSIKLPNMILPFR